jgi:hypothetical protein
MPHCLLSLLGYTGTGLTTGWSYKGVGKEGGDTSKGKIGFEDGKNGGEGADLTLRTGGKRGRAD